MIYTYENFPKYEADTIADNFPMASYEELDLLKSDILEKKRVINPIVLYNGKILDGRNRYKALTELFEQDEIDLEKDSAKTPLEIEVNFEEYDTEKQKSKDEVKMYADSLNLVRRHLTASQKAGLAFVLFKDKFNKIAKEKKDNETGGIKLDSKERSTTAEDFGNFMGVNATYIKKALAIISADVKVGEKILKYVYNEYLDINKAAALMKLSVEERTKAIEKLEKKINEIETKEKIGVFKDKKARRDKTMVVDEIIKDFIGKQTNKKNYVTNDEQKIAVYLPFEVNEKVMSKIASVLYENIFYEQVGDEQKFNIAVITNADSLEFEAAKENLKVKLYDGLSIKDKYAVKENVDNGDNSQG